MTNKERTIEAIDDELRRQAKQMIDHPSLRRLAAVDIYRRRIAARRRPPEVECDVEPPQAGGTGSRH